MDNSMAKQQNESHENTTPRETEPVIDAVMMYP
jgi:hypothetical protein